MIHGRPLPLPAPGLCGGLVSAGQQEGVALHTCDETHCVGVALRVCDETKIPVNVHRFA